MVVPIEHNLVLIKTLIHDQLRNSIQAFFTVLFIAMCLSDDIYVSRHKRFVLSADKAPLSAGEGGGGL